MIDLHELLGRIVAEGSDKGHIQALSVSEQAKHAFGLNPDGLPVLLIHCEAQERRRPPFTQHALQVRYNEPWEVGSSGGKAIETFTSLTCLSRDAETQKYFSFMCETFLKILGNKPSNAEIDNMLKHMMEIFRKLGRPCTRELNGLFGELYYLSCTRSPKIALAAWHLRDGDKYDFSTDKACVEVKTCASKTREHQFSMEQCHPKTEHGLLVSIQIVRNDLGLSLRDLQLRIEELVGNDANLLHKFYDNVAQCLGDKLPASLDISINEEIAKESMRIYNLRDIPSIKLEDVPREVSQVKFSSNLATAKELKTSDLKKIKALANFLPKD